MSEKAKALRADLKAAGYKGREVTVKHEHFSLGSEIVVTVRNPEIQIAGVKAIANGYEKIDRCEFSGEILGGGNTYLSVRYSDEALSIREDRVLPAINIALERLAGHPNDRTLESAAGYEIGHYDRFYHVWKDGQHIGQAYPDAHAPGQIARIMVA